MRISALSKLLSLVFIALLLIFSGWRLVSAFVGPTQAPPSGEGVIKPDANSANIGVGVSADSLTKLLVATTTGNTWGFRVGRSFAVRNDGHVGIATTTPDLATAVINGDLWVTGTINGGGIGATINANYVTPGVFGCQTDPNCGPSGNYSFPKKLGIATTTQATLPPVSLSVFTIGGSQNAAYFAGNVGIGILDQPKAPLHINSVNTDTTHPFLTIRVHNKAAGVGYSAGIGFGSDDPVDDIMKSAIVHQRQLPVSTGGAGDLIFLVDTATDDFSVEYSDEKMRITREGNIGIGTYPSKPSSTLSVAGGVAVGSTYAVSPNVAPSNGLIVQGSAGIGTTVPKGKLDVAGGVAVGSYAGVNTPPSNSLIVSGNVGIGNNNPSTPLDISGNIGGDLYAHIKNTNAAGRSFFRSENNSGITASFGLGGLSGQSLNVNRAFLETSGSGSGAGLSVGSNGDIAFSTGGAATMRLGIDTNGNVTVGTSNSGGRLEVVSASQSTFRLKKTAGSGGSVDLFPAVGTGAQSGSTACTNVSATSLCLASWNSAGVFQASCSTLTSGSAVRALCADFGD